MANQSNQSNPSTALKDPFHSPSREFYRDPYPTLKRLRQEAPVFWSEKGNYWIVTRFHHCMGSALAETEGQIALSTLFQRMPNLHMTRDKLERKEPFSLRGFKSLPVAF
jgi:cytochrome P450